MMKKIILSMFLAPSLVYAGHPLTFLVYNQAQSEEPVIIVLETLKDSHWDKKCEDSIAPKQKRPVCTGAIELDDTSSEFHGRISFYFGKISQQNQIGQSEFSLKNVNNTLGNPHWYWSNQGSHLIPFMDHEKTFVKFHTFEVDTVFAHLLRP